VRVSANATLAIGQSGGLVARYSGGSFYAARIYQASGTQVRASIVKYVNGVWMTIPGAVGLTVNIKAGVSDAMAFQAERPSRKLFLGGSLVAFAQDTMLTSGSVGIYTYGRGSIDSFGVAALPSGQTLPHSDALTSGSPGNQLDNSAWIERAGNFKVTANGAVGQTGDNVAT